MHLLAFITLPIATQKKDSLYYESNIESIVKPIPPTGRRVPNEPYRAGAYRLGAFHPTPLPPAPAIRMDAALQRRLGDANLALGRLDGAIQTLPNPGHFVLMYIRKEAVLSSQIEGTQSSLTDLLAAEAEVLADDALRDVDEVVNYISALNHGLKRLDTLPVSLRLIHEIHERLLAGIRGGHLAPGALRTTQNWIGPIGATQAEATFVPPPPQEVGAALADLERFLHAEDDTPFLVKVGLAADHAPAVRAAGATEACALSVVLVQGQPCDLL
jgi:hypothetical protein